MLLAIDVGNTNTVFALYRGEELVGQWRLSTNRERTAEEYAAALIQLMHLKGFSHNQVGAVVISSVVPQAVIGLRWMSRDFFGCRAFVVGEDLDYPIKINLNNPHEVGADRVVNAVAARRRYPPPLIIVDFGTATTFDVVNEEGSYCGGAIAPGINLSLEALHRAAAKLPRIAVEPPENVIGTSTITAMQSGVFWGYVGLIEGLVGRIQAEFGQPMSVVATGGLAPLFAKRCPTLQHTDRDLTMAGLLHIYELKSGLDSIRKGTESVKFTDLRFVPLGGVGEIGVNCYLYGQKGRWAMVDLGLGFPDDRLPGVDIVLPDLRFIEEQRAFLDGLILTHAHEDHLGAVPYLWPRLGCPVWCTPFTAAVLRAKLGETDFARDVKIRIVEPGQSFEVAGLRCRFVHVTHSIPDANALVIDTEFGRLLHTGDWKLDPAPLVGARTDVDALELVGREGVLAMLCDSTNVLSPGTSGSEAEVRDSLTELIKRQSNRVVLTSFSSNIARLETAMLAARAAGRELFVVGRSMRRMIDAAREVGYLKDVPPIRDEREADLLPRGRVLYLCTGSQGEARSALSRVAAGQHPRVRLEPNDTVIFSAKIIPGNERTLYNLHNQLVRSGIEVITEGDHFVHVSGHPCRDELEQMYRWIRPKIAIPVHGEARHLHAHQRLAQQMGVEQALLIENGDMVRLAPGTPEVIDEVPVGRVVAETEGLVGTGDDLFRARRRLMNHGTILVSLVLDDHGSVLAPPQLTAVGALELERFGERRASVCDAITDAVEDLSDRDVRDDERVRELVRGALRLALDLARHRRPIVEVQITRLGADVLAAFEPEEETVP